jgi:hypothetical protein
LHQRPSGAGKMIVEFKDESARDELLQAITAALKQG